MSYSGPGHCRAYLTGNPECHVNVGDSAGSKWWVPFLFIYGVSHCSTSYIKFTSFCIKASNIRSFLVVDQGHFKEVNHAQWTLSNFQPQQRLCLPVDTGILSSQVTCRRSQDHSTQIFFGILSELILQVNSSMRGWTERLIADISTTSAVMQSGVEALK